MALPLVTYNPWDIDPDSCLPKLMIFPEIVYIFENNKSILQFKMVDENEEEDCAQLFNCSTFINELFGKSFS